MEQEDPSESTAGDRIRTVRREMGLSQADLAQSVEVSVITVSRWETGAIGNIGSDLLIKLGAALRVSVDWLLTGRGPREREAA